jgi:hypothetical protein
VRGKNGSGEGPWSERFVVRTNVPAPFTPMIFHSSETSATSTTLCWGKPLDEAFPVTAYEVIRLKYFPCFPLLATTKSAVSGAIRIPTLTPQNLLCPSQTQIRQWKSIDEKDPSVMEKRVWKRITPTDAGADTLSKVRLMSHAVNRSHLL